MADGKPEHLPENRSLPPREAFPREPSVCEWRNQVNLEISGDTNVWIYEIVRCERDGGTEKKQSVGYAYAHDGEAVFTDVAATANNRVYTYEITGYDKWLEKTEPGRTKEGQGEPQGRHRPDLMDRQHQRPTVSWRSRERIIRIPMCSQGWKRWWIWRLRALLPPLQAL